MKRKVIQLAEKTHVISLPLQWVKKYGIQKSDELTVEEKDNILLVSTNADIIVPERTTVDISGLKEDLVKSIVSVLHKVGYDEIEFLFDNPSIMDVIHRRVEELIGFEVIEQSQRRCVIKNVSGDLSHELDNMVRRTFRVTLSLANQSLELIQEQKFTQLPELLHLEKTNNRLTNYCHRILNKRSRGPHTVFLYSILWLLESIADEYRDICVLMKDYNSPIDKDILDVFDKINKHLDAYYQFFYTKTHEEMENLRRENELIKAQIKGILSTNPILMQLYNITQNIYDCFGSTTGKKFLQEHK